ncbi:CapA family protein [Winogradskyella luteola]|uniref:CapA family protein n=1 Tax=Winogradskyella luteola TaxID=2828330 RepID=A0A9X1F8Q7_9FLAO|nr:CapA family protein [Winogradskyella luteola]MBV7269249.1 CapA family protein [Winogradskyella luteola]
MKIIIGGDVCPINTNENHFNGNSEVFCDLQNEFNESDLNIINLEVPLTDSSKKILKSGPNIKGAVSAAKSINTSKVHLVSLANNHIGDFSEEGVIDTLEVCESNNIKTVGAGVNLKTAKQPFISETSKKVAVISMSDTEFGIANDNEAGANPLDLCELTLQLLEIKNKVDYTIVILHEGKEHYKYPSPDLQKICRYICDVGADLVICQHSHICGAWERYKKSNIFYGQGNLMFDYANRNSDNWKLGFLIKVKLLDNGDININQIPFKQTFPGIRRLDKEEEKLFRQQSIEMQKNVLDANFISTSWDNFIKKYRSLYYSVFRGHNKIIRKINSYIPISNLFYSPMKKAILLNAIRSRVHREVVISILEKDVNG